MWTSKSSTAAWALASTHCKGGGGNAGLLSRFTTHLLILAAAAPFIPGAWQFIRRGVPDVLLTGDGGTLELRVLHASHGTQLLGPYSRFQWSHPGPAFFYLALPFYEIFKEHGPALNLCAFVLNSASAVALVLSARKLRGPAFALAAAALLAIYECVDPIFSLSGEWNPVTPILPLAFLSLLCARLGIGNLGVLPVFAFVASAMVQTHLGFVPVVLSLAAVSAVCLGLRRLLGRPAPAAAHLQQPHPPRRSAWVLAWTAAVLFVVWLPPLIENATSRPGNLSRLFEFFTAPHGAEHTWGLSITTVAERLAALPLAMFRLIGFASHPSSGAVLGIATGEVVAVAVALGVGLRRRDDAAVIVSSIALTEIAAAVTAVHAIRGDIYPHLVAWVTVVGWVAVLAGAACVIPLGEPLAERKATLVASAFAAFAIVGLCVRREGGSVNVFRSHDRDAEKLANDVESTLVSEHIDHPLVRIATGDQWPTVVAVVLQLFKHHVPIYVEQYWLFMMGTEFAERSAGHTQLVFGDRAFYESVRQRPDYRLVATAGDSFAFVADPDYVREHRLAESPRLISATGVAGEPQRAVDGVIPPDGTPWDSALSVVLKSTDSTIEVAVPQADVDGLFLSADGSDTYAILCRSEGGTFSLGSILAGVPIGMGTGVLVSPKLQSCRSVMVEPEHGDGYYSIGEIGFLRRR